MVKIRDGIRTATTEDGCVLLDIRENQILTTNLVGSQILELIKKGFEENEIKAEISRLYGLSIDVAATDVREFLQSLKERGIIVESAVDQKA
jgi:hypothetical protein